MAVNSYFNTLDPDAAAFCRAANIYNLTQVAAINALVLGLKADGLWNPLSVIYPVVGGNSFSHSVNLKNPSQFRMTYSFLTSGVIVHSSTGMLFDGLSACNTGFNMQTLAAANYHFSVYCRTNRNANEIDLGATTSADPNSLVRLYTFNTTATADLPRLNGAATVNGNVSGNGAGFTVASRDSSTSLNLYKNGVNIGNSTVDIGSQALTPRSIFLGATNNGFDQPNSGCRREHAFCTIGSNLTSTQNLNLYNRVQTYQTALGRQV